MYIPIKSWAKRDRKVSKEGYILIKIPEHPKNFRGWYYEHRLIIEKQLNRVVPSLPFIPTFAIIRPPGIKLKSSSISK